LTSVRGFRIPHPILKKRVDKVTKQRVTRRCMHQKIKEAIVQALPITST
jgi:hypothetical protein